MADHKCYEHLRHHTNHVIETHGLDCGPYQEYDEEWEECSLCGEQFDGFDLANLMKDAEAEAEYEASFEEHCDYLAAHKESING